MYFDKNTLGHSGYYYFFGTIEDRDDPLKIGRVKVRCFGIHSQSSETLPTSTLPWANVITPTTASELIIHDMKVGCVVHGFFADGDEMQKPFVTGVVAGLTADGKTSSLSSYATQQGTRRAAQFKDSDPYAGKYPYVHAYESESGHVIELDDTAGAERVHIFHRAGSYVEFTPNGDINVKSDGVVNIKCPLVHIDGNVVVSGDVVASGVSLVHHTHGGVLVGSGHTKEPD